MRSAADDQRFRRVFTAHFDAVSRYCLRRLPLNEVNDTVAEVFAVVWRKVDRVPTGDAELPWIYGVARHEINNRRRSRRRFRALTEKLAGQALPSSASPERAVVRSAEFDDLVVALRSLSRADREVLLLRTQEELDYAQIGVAIGCSPDAARKRVTRAISRLRSAAGIREPRHVVAESRAIEEGGEA